MPLCGSCTHLPQHTNWPLLLHEHWLLWAHTCNFRWRIACIGGSLSCLNGYTLPTLQRGPATDELYRVTKAQLLFLKVKEHCCASIFILEPSRGWRWGEISVESYLCFILPLASPSSLTSLQVCLLRTLPHKSLAKLLGSGSASRDPVSVMWVARKSSCGSRPSWLTGFWGLLPVMYMPRWSLFQATYPE